MSAAPAVPHVEVLGDGALRAAVSAALRSTAPPVEPAACLVPRVPDAAPLAELTDERLAADVGDVLAAVLAAVQHTLPALRGGGRLVVVLPHVPLMGAAGFGAAAAVAGGVLSLSRTLAIELARDAITVNVVALDAARPAEAALAGHLAALLGPGGEAVTGQETYLTAGADLGRLRP